MQDIPSTVPELPKTFDVDDVQFECEDESAIWGGTIEIWTPDYSEKRKLRPYIAATIVVIWGIGIIASAIRAFMTGDVLIVVPPAIITLPLMTVLRFYFGNDQKEKDDEHDKSIE